MRIRAGGNSCFHPAGVCCDSPTIGLMTQPAQNAPDAHMRDSERNGGSNPGILLEIRAYKRPVPHGRVFPQSQAVRKSQAGAGYCQWRFVHRHPVQIDRRL